MASSRITRRDLLAGAATVLPAQGLVRGFAAANLTAAIPKESSRAQESLELRQRTARTQSLRAQALMRSNGDEDSFPNRIACYAKGLPQNRFGEVEPPAYEALLRALRSGLLRDFEAIPRSGGRHLSNPMCGMAFHLEGGDPHTFDLPPAPTLRSQEAVADMQELYWQASCRDVPFSSYSQSDLIRQASAGLNKTPETVFRSVPKATLNGPYISQFLLKPIPFGAASIEQKYILPAPQSDFMTTLSEWSQIQLGFPPWRMADYETQPRYIRTGRDLAEYVHYDFAYQAFLNAALILINGNSRSILNCNQFKSSNNPYRYSTVEDGFATFGPPEALDWLGRVTTAALKAAYCQKWIVHRRVRPEALGGLIHQTRLGTRIYDLPTAMLQSDALKLVFSKTGSYLLPQAYPEGCPLHPSYPSGHAAIAGACSIILKACFDGYMLLPNAVEPSDDGLSLKPRSDFSPTVADEIDKLAFNVAMGRNWAGIHYRSDNEAGLRLGEEVAISILQDLAGTFAEDFKGFKLQRMDGRLIHIHPDGQVNENDPQRS